ncbi:Aste57867_11664 [Aphanomyces stellatus]|uniref:Aste57867_11664 protein n=1 Tax=Aphanomyces stellatus TaxID=120398 RepID=A0A485KTL1_9STRA|nr:hypothetical protein As57867_011621 [Aphanomyces stellatus]VFT88522.1 Aste57867_11664 [Aphanomyces stellatus]
MPSIPPRTAFLSGATGFLGANVVTSLTRDGWRVIALVRSSSKLDWLKQHANVECVVGTITDAASIAAAMPKHVDCVFHVAATLVAWAPRHEEQWRTNVDGTQAMIDAALQQNAKRFVHVSSTAVYGNRHSIIDETTPRDGDKSAIHYFRSKHAAEERVRAAIATKGLPAVIIQPSAIIGPHDTTGFARLFVMIAQNNLAGIPPAANSFCYGPCVAEAVVAAATRGRVGEHYALPGADATYQEMIAEAAMLLGKTETRQSVPLWVLKLIGRVKDVAAWFSGKEPDLSYENALMVGSTTFVRSSKARDELGYQTMTMAEMLPPTIMWLKTNHYV